ncbi:MAG: FHA domain-containing protein [Verrucomicrobiae bacterium]|nr:FHA domain-containing protein [Verrucomicrobiae bacterium]
MARVLIKTAVGEPRACELNLGVNHFGRHPDCDFTIEHPTVSTAHCEMVLTAEGVLLRDCGSTNGTFINGEPVKEAMLQAGQTVRLGDVELLVETTEVIIAIPEYERPRPAPPVVLDDGSMLCPRHPEAVATHQCTFCREILCDACVRRLRRKGGRTLKLCPLCSQRCEVIGGEQPKKKTFMGMLNKTIKLPFLRRRKNDD